MQEVQTRSETREKEDDVLELLARRERMEKEEERRVPKRGKRVRRWQ